MIINVSNYITDGLTPDSAQVIYNLIKKNQDEDEIIVNFSHIHYFALTFFNIFSKLYNEMDYSKIKVINLNDIGQALYNRVIDNANNSIILSKKQLLEEISSY